MSVVTEMDRPSSEGRAARDAIDRSLGFGRPWLVDRERRGNTGHDG